MYCLGKEINITYKKGSGELFNSESTEHKVKPLSDLSHKEVQISIDHPYSQSFYLTRAHANLFMRDEQNSFSPVIEITLQKALTFKLQNKSLPKQTIYAEDQTFVNQYESSLKNQIVKRLESGSEEFKLNILIQI